MKKLILLIICSGLLFSCQKPKQQTVITNYTVTYLITGNGVYHITKGSIEQSGHISGHQSFTFGAEHGNSLELDAQADTITKSISIEIDISPGSNYKKSGTGKQQLNYQL